MNDCKHRWQESHFGQKYREAKDYMFACARCGEYRYVAPNNVSPGSPVVHEGATGSQATAQAEATAKAQAAAQA